MVLVVLLCPFLEIWLALPGYSTAATWAALPISVSVYCIVFLCVQTVVLWPTVFGIFNMHAICVDACELGGGGGGGGGCKKVCTGSWLGKRSLATPRTRTCISIVPGFSVKALPTELSMPCYITIAQSMCWSQMPRWKGMLRTMCNNNMHCPKHYQLVNTLSAM